MSDVETARQQVIKAEKVEAQAQQKLLYVAAKAKGLPLAAKHGLTPQDEVWKAAEDSLANATIALHHARLDLQAARMALVQAEHQAAEGDMPHFDQQLALCKAHDFTLWEKYQQALQALSGTTIEAQRERWRYVLRRLQMQVRAFRLPAAEQASPPSLGQGAPVA